MGLSLEPEDVQALEARTEGWIVGLQLAALALQGTHSVQDRDSAGEFISSFTGSHHYVLEYLTEEVVGRQPEAVREFLIQTSILDRICGPLCDAVCAAPEDAQESLPIRAEVLAEVGDGETMLAHLQQRNLFIIPLDDEWRWYRYHHLFADLLRNLLRRERPAEQIRALHLRASAWHEQHGALEDAIQHALEGQDFDAAAALIAGAAQGLLAQGRLLTLLRWTEALPREVLCAQPHLRLYQGWALHLSRHSDEARRILQDTKETLQGLPATPETEALRGQVAALLTGIASIHQDPATIIQEGQEALAFLPEDDRTARARTYIALGTAYAYQDGLDRAARTLRQARELALEAGNAFLATAAIELLAGMQIFHLGQLPDGAQTLQQVLDLGTAEDGTRQPFMGTAHALLAEIYLEWNDLDAAESYLETGLELQALSGIGYGLIHSMCTKARFRQARGDAEGALAAMAAAEKALQAIPMWHLIVHHAYCQVQLRLWLGDLATASLWANGEAAAIQGALPENLPTYLDELLQISRAQVQLACEDPAHALAILEGLDSQAQAAGRTAQVIQVCLVKALAQQALGNPGAALESFSRSLWLAEPAGYARLFLEGGQPVITLLRRAARRGTSSGYAGRLLAAVEGPGSGQEPAPQAGIQVPVPVALSLAEPLTRRELEVLDLIGQGYSNQQISEKLVVTLHTVKKHSSNVYGKLGVTGRTQAIVRARELGLLN
jgi:LuxR family maltose regulon positive regulatory protein